MYVHLYMKLESVPLYLIFLIIRFAYYIEFVMILWNHGQSEEIMH